MMQLSLPSTLRQSSYFSQAVAPTNWVRDDQRQQLTQIRHCNRWSSSTVAKEEKNRERRRRGLIGLSRVPTVPFIISTHFSTPNRISAEEDDPWATNNARKWGKISYPRKKKEQGTGNAGGVFVPPPLLPPPMRLGRRPPASSPTSEYNAMMVATAAFLSVAYQTSDDTYAISEIISFDAKRNAAFKCSISVKSIPHKSQWSMSEY